MTKRFIAQARSIVLSNMAEENFGANELASLLGLSTSQTLRKTKAATGKSVNKFIRDIRLQEASQLIQKTDLTFAEISHKVGFASASYFSKTFSKQYGITPGEFKTRKIPVEELAAKSEEKSFHSILSNKKILVALGVLLVVVIGYVAIKNTGDTNKINAVPNSIAVLPFKDLSQEDNQWFCDGVSDNILHSLAQMDDLLVTSFTSSSTFRDSDKQIPQIAKELGVSYILEGSVVMHNDKIKVIAQLIDANDQHVWSKEYNEDFDDIIAVQNNVAHEVMQQLQITLSAAEEKTLEKYPTKNMEAYHLHLEGRIINQSKERSGLQRNIEYNQRAIALDSNFAEAYAEVAGSKMLLAINSIDTPFGFSYIDEPIKKIKEAQFYVNKALEIDPNSAKANAVKARLFLGNNESESEAYFKKAIALNPNDADSRHWYANYFLTSKKRDLKKALEQATIAQQLSPFSPEIAARYGWTLILNKKFDKVDAFIKDYGFILSSPKYFIITLTNIAHKNKDWQPALDWIQNKLEEDPENADYYMLTSIGHERGYRDKEKAIDLMKKAYDLNPRFFPYYFRRLNRFGFLKEAEEQLQSDDFKSLSESRQSNLLWYYH